MGSRRNNQGARSLHCRGYDTIRIGEKDLREVFSKYGKVIDVYLPKDYFTKKVRGFAYIQFENEEDADVARQKLDRTDIFNDSRPVNIMWAAGERKTPSDMRRLDIERDNPHARRARERAIAQGRDWDRELDRDWGDRRDRRPWGDRRGRDWDRERDWDRDREWDRERDWGRGPRRGFGYGGGRYSSRSPPPGNRRDDRPERGPPREFERKRLRSRSPSPDRRYEERRWKRRESRSPPPVRRRSASPRRSRSRSPRSRSPAREREEWNRERGVSPQREDREKKGRAPLSPVETTPASPESRER